jgi:hypothetical protein
MRAVATSVPSAMSAVAATVAQVLGGSLFEALQKYTRDAAAAAAAALGRTEINLMKLLNQASKPATIDGVGAR